jgi:hypothetical protein
VGPGGRFRSLSLSLASCLGGCILMIDDWEARVISSLKESREKRSMTLRPSAFSRTADKSTALVVHVGDSQWLRVPSECRTQLSNCNLRLLAAQFANQRTGADVRYTFKGKRGESFLVFWDRDREVLKSNRLLLAWPQGSTSKLSQNGPQRICEARNLIG